jgi:UTP--glucose-1-phosphate uridylyltransferase
MPRVPFRLPSAKATRAASTTVLRARKHIGDEPFAVLLGDDLLDEQDGVLEEMARVQALTGGSVVGLLEVDPSQISAYGCIDAVPQTGGHLRVRCLVEEPDASAAPSNVAVIGRYVLHPRIFEVLAETGTGRGGEIQLTDALQTLAVADGPRSGVYGVPR